VRIVDVEGIGPSYAKKLKASGVATTEALLKRAGKPKDRDALAKASGIAPKLLLEWLNHADLARIKGVGGQFADLLEAAGVDSPAELAQRNAKNLAAGLATANAKQRLVRRVPSEKVVAGWIAQAKKLPKVVTH